MRTWLTSALFAATIFLGSFLLFASEPIQGKMLLPWLGGTPAVWNGCLMFFQGVLLLGYLYAHLLSTKLKLARQVAVHAVVLLLPLAFLPVRIPEGLAETTLLQQSPLLWLLTTLTVTIGPAFFVIAATSPLLQSWFVQARGGSVKNPYVLYAASNAGSLLALLCYPLVVEPELPLGLQTRVWAGAYGGLALLTMATGALAWRRAKALRVATATAVATSAHTAAMPATVSAAGLGAADVSSMDMDSMDIDTWNAAAPEPGDDEALAPAALWRTRALWILQAAVPSSLMLGVTTYLTTDIAAIPLLWILPLALYTLSFVLVFARYERRADSWLSRLAMPAVAVLLFLIYTEIRDNLWLVITLHLSCFFILAVTAHGRLALSRPAPRQLTAYYFFMALGGVLGGTFNSLLAPLLFRAVTEYPLAVLAAALICAPSMAGAASAASSLSRRLLVPGRTWILAGAAAAAALTYGLFELHEHGVLAPWGERAVALIPEDEFSGVVIYGVPCLAFLLLSLFRRRVTLNLATGAICGFVAITMVRDLYTATVYQSRSFFGVLTVRSYENGDTYSLVHGGILHGEQWRKTPEDRAEPRSYYHKEGPLGQIIATLDENVEHPRIAAIGLGAGTVAAYGKSDNSITFYELDPNVERLARNPTMFSYVDDCLKRWCNLKVVIGDGRLQIAQADEAYDLIIVDAFSSDAIPVHLLTLEALRTYISKLTTSGIVAFHISNRYVDLEPVLYNLATELNLGYALRSDEDDDDVGEGASTWVVLAAREGLFEKFAVDDERWRGLETKPGIGLWRDDFANVARSFIWN